MGARKDEKKKGGRREKELKVESLSNLDLEIGCSYFFD